jgi:hypothetical protein
MIYRLRDPAQTVSRQLQTDCIASVVVPFDALNQIAGRWTNATRPVFATIDWAI